MDEKEIARSPEEIAARVELTRAETRKMLAEALAAEQAAETGSIALDKARESREKELAGDHYARIYRFNAAVGDKSVMDCINVLTLWDRIDANCDIEIIFNSPGGSVVDGMALFDFIEELEAKGHKVTTTALGIAASMAGILLQAGTRRRMGKEAWVLIHQASFGSQGSFGQVEDTVEWVKKVQDRILDIFAKRAAESGAAKPMSRAAIKRNWERKDWWLSSAECLLHGFVDEVL